MVKIISTTLALSAVYYGLVAFASAAKLSTPRTIDVDLGPVDYQCPEGFLNYPHEMQCELYYHCAVGETPTHLFHCEGDMLFDLLYYGCNFKELVDCGDRLEPFTCPSPNGNFPVSPNACDSRYYVCVNGEPTLKECPNGDIFDTLTGSCGAPETVICTTTTTFRTPTAPGPFTCPEPNGQYPSPYTCTQYYVCVENMPILMECPFGLYYNPATKQCDWPENVPSCTARIQMEQ